MRYVCSVCGYVYDEAREKTAFSDLPDSWKCPVCKAAKAAFVPEAPKEGLSLRQSPCCSGMNTVSEEEHFTKLSVGQLAALCSNLARGCEKQYRGKKRLCSPAWRSTLPRVRRRIRRPPWKPFLPLWQRTSKKAIPLSVQPPTPLRQGTKRSVYGRKGHKDAAFLLSQYESEGEAFLRDTPVWVCSVCGFVYVGGEPPEICPVCKVPSWKFDQIEGREPA